MSHVHTATPRPHRLDAFLPWMVSLTFHLAVGLVVAFAYFLTLNALSSTEAQTIVVPNSFQDPSFSEHPGTAAPGSGGDPLRQGAQDRLKDLARAEGWGDSGTQNVSAILGGHTDAVGIFAGSGAAVSPGVSGNGAAAYGTPGGGSGSGPRSSFYGTGGNATRIVYILDHSGSMLDNFEFLKEQAVKSVGNLSANQFFAVILVSDRVSNVGPAQLQRALPESKKQFADLLRKEVAEGANDGMLGPFEQAFSRAFAMDPELVYFLTDGKFGDGLITKVAEFNKNRRVHINTIAFVTEEPLYKGQLQQLAQENGGTYKFVPQKDVGN
jgi:hypothetical protein